MKVWGDPESGPTRLRGGESVRGMRNGERLTKQRGKKETMGVQGKNKDKRQKDRQKRGKSRDESVRSKERERDRLRASMEEREREREREKKNVAGILAWTYCITG